MSVLVTNMSVLTNISALITNMTVLVTNMYALVTNMSCRLQTCLCLLQTCLCLLQTCLSVLQTCLLFLQTCLCLLQTCLSLLQTWRGTGGFQEQGQCFFIGQSCSIATIVFYSLSLSLLSVYTAVLLKLTWPAASLSAKKILSAPQLVLSILTFITHRCNETVKQIFFFKLFIEIHCCKIHRTNKKYNKE